MESYYNSDEEIAWGPLTLREIKKEFEQQPKKINHRQTDLGCYNTSSFAEVNPVADKASEENTKSNTSGTSSYFTPNESFQSESAINKNDLFLEKLSKVIEGDGKEEFENSLYVSAVSKSKPANDTIMRILNSERRSSNNLDNIHQTLVELSPHQDNMKFVEKNSTTENRFTQNSYSDSSDDIIVITDDSSDESVEYIYEPIENLVKHERRSKISEIIHEKEDEEIHQDFDSDSSEDIADLLLELNKIREKQKSLSMNAEFDTLEHGECQNEEIEHSHCLQLGENLLQKDCDNATENTNITFSEQEVSSTEEKSNLQRNEEIVTNDLEEGRVQSFIKVHQYHSPHKNLQSEQNDEISPSKSPLVEEEVIGKLEFIKLKPDSMNISGVDCLSNHSQLTTSNSDNCNDFKLVCVPENSVATISRENSSNMGSNDSAVSEHTEPKSESLVFNDTLEEMEMALKQGLNFIEQENNVTTEMKTNINIEHATNTETVVKKKILKPSSLKKFDYVTSPIGNYIKKQKSPMNDNFKLPQKPIRSKIPLTPRSPLVQTKQFKNVISPIGVYIKNSPGVCFKQNIPVKTVPSIQKYAIPNEVKKNKENVVTEMPQVIYKPPKRTVAVTKKDVNLPSSIQKLVPEPEIIKHEMRIKSQMNSTTVSRKLLEGDLTVTDSSLLGQSSDDISFVTKKQAFIK